MSPQPPRGVIRRSKTWNGIDKAELSLSRWQELLPRTAKSSVCWTLSSEAAAATACWRNKKPLKRCPELPDQDESNDGKSSVRDFSFRLRSAGFTQKLFPSFISLSVLLSRFSGSPQSSSSTLCEKRLEEKVKAWRGLLWITRDINFIFQSFLVPPSSLFCGCLII